MQQGKKQTQPGSRELWLTAASELLAEGGIAAVKIMPLAKRIGQTRTGFYWYFKDHAELLDALLELWEARTTEVLIARAQEDSGTLCDAVFGLLELWIRPDLFDAQMDQSIRNWALNDMRPRAQLDRADKMRVAAVAGLFDRYGYGANEAQARAQLFLLAQAGHAMSPGALHSPEALADLVEYLCGMKPTPSEIRRFMDRDA